MSKRSWPDVEPEVAPEHAWPRGLAGCSSYADPGTRVEYGDGGNCLVATREFRRGEVVAVFGGVALCTPWHRLPDDAHLAAVQVEEDVFLMSSLRGGADHINHSCDPNLWLDGQIVLVARFPIDPGEELSYDYATTDSSPYDEFDCCCGSVLCRGRITGSDWMLPELQVRYEHHFSPYLRRRQARRFAT